MRTDVLLVSRRFPPAPGGVEDQVREIGSRLVRDGYGVLVYTSDLYSDIPPQRLPDLPSPDFEGMRVERFRAVPVLWHRRMGTSITPMMWCACLASRHLPAIVHFHGLNLVTASASLMVRKGHGRRTLLTTHADPGMLSPRLARFLMRFDGLVALTEIEFDRMISLGLDESRIRLIPNGIDTTRFRSLPSRQVFRNSLGIDDCMILYAGRVDVAQKGCDVLVDAVSRVQARMGACTLVFSGPDWGSVNYLRELARNMGVSAVFTGNLSPDDLKTALVACDVLVLPSISEAFGMSAIEAMICGAPVVATRVGGIPSIVHHEKTGLLVSPRDPQQLADAICRILTEEQLRSRIIANALKLAEGYRIEKTVALLERFYSDLLDL